MNIDYAVCAAVAVVVIVVSPNLKISVVEVNAVVVLWENDVVVVDDNFGYFDGIVVVGDVNGGSWFVNGDDCCYCLVGRSSCVVACSRNN